MPRSVGGLAVPAWFWFVFWFLACLVLLILAGLVVHLLGGGILSLHAGHFVFDLGAT